MESPSVVHKTSNGKQTGSVREKPPPFWVCAWVHSLKFKEVLLTHGKRKLLAWFWRFKTAQWKRNLPSMTALRFSIKGRKRYCSSNCLQHVRNVSQPWQSKVKEKTVIPFLANQETYGERRAFYSGCEAWLILLSDKNYCSFPVFRMKCFLCRTKCCPSLSDLRHERKLLSQ